MSDTRDHDDEPVDGAGGLTEPLWQRLREAEPRLDDLRRARLLAGIRAQLSEEPSDQADDGHGDDDGDGDGESAFVPAGHRRRLQVALVIGLVAAAAALFLVWRGSAPEPGGQGPTLAEIDPLARVQPYLYQGPDAYPTGRPVRALALGDAALLRASLGGQGHFTLHGPAQLSVEPSADAGAGDARPAATDHASGDASGDISDNVRLHLERGLLVADYRHAPGRSLTVITRDARVLVTGTLFAVEASDDAPTRVSVMRGSVQVTSGSRASRAVAAGQSWTADVGYIGPMSEETRALMEEHAAAPTPMHAGRAPGAPADPGDVHTSGAAAGDGERAAVRRILDAGESAAPALQGTAEELYRDAETAMGKGESARARSLLRALLGRYPDDALVDVAHYELGRMAFDAADYARARRHLGAVVERGRDPVFLEPAAYLRCRVELADARASAARQCLRGFRDRFPRSPSDAEALWQLATLAAESGGCAAALPLWQAYLRQHAGARHAAEAAQRAQACR
ncbi:FecR domain-containing protein [Haliangium ochraceum]|uniref:FecR protein n=1 Tax=Haliangium ochraceum (strain DSM 14365 / JCM 11303 / SMP-2) TaxID=502025 RepID=D0LIW8_HALO1|nr:FecR domain-containing protein [Haliangium ochraceum]ACY12997.1 FecR protein [Haliangium ochraceum DSM 14365]